MMCAMATILLVDDEPDLLTVWRLLFGQQGYQVITAPDGAQALERLRSVRPDVFVTDCMMPHMDGPALCRALYDDAQYRTIPVILCSAAVHPPRQLNPVIEYCRKPVDPDWMFSTIVEMIRPAQPPCT